MTDKQVTIEDLLHSVKSSNPDLDYCLTIFKIIHEPNSRIVLNLNYDVVVFFVLFFFSRRELGPPVIWKPLCMKYAPKLLLGMGLIIFELQSSHCRKIFVSLSLFVWKLGQFCFNLKKSECLSRYTEQHTRTTTQISKSHSTRWTIFPMRFC